jgi:hypothetical protein
MNVPSVPNDRKVVDENGNLTEVWASFFSNLITQLNDNLSDEGYVLPSQNSANIAILSTDGNKSRILWNSDTEKAMVNNDGTFAEIDTL